MKQCSKCGGSFDNDNLLFCPKCRSMLHLVNENYIHKESKSRNIRPGPNTVKGSSNCWLFIRNWWYNDFANRYKDCNLYYEQKDINIKNLRPGDRVIFYNKYEFIGTALIKDVKKDITFSEIDCSINKTYADGFSYFGNVIVLSDIDIFEPDFTVDVHEIKNDLNLIKGKKTNEELDEFLKNGNWWIHLKGSIKSLDLEDYNLILQKAQEYHSENKRNLLALKQFILQRGGQAEKDHIGGFIFKALGEPEWILDSDGYFTNNAHQIMKTKLAKVGILYEPKESKIKIVELEEGEFLTGDGERCPSRGYRKFIDNGEVVKLSDIKDEILSGKIVDEDGWLVYSNPT